MDEIKKLKVYQFPRDIHTEMDDIKEIITAKTGMKVSNVNLMRILLKNWYDTNNNG
tara:strand:+ start:796 stop:963 length:168 start_codon:yes stop_codon:yes gene_type:complete